VRQFNVPLVIPMVPETFQRPSDWGNGIHLTDFIFLRGKGKTASTLPEALHNFVTKAKDDGAKLGLMTFSSMPVKRATVLSCCVKMVEKCEHNLRMIYVGKRQPDEPDTNIMQRVHSLTAESRLFEIGRADFGVLFPEMDVFVIHGGLGTTVEALRMKKPIAVSGPLLLDQRFWGRVCFEKGVGPEAVHIDNFSSVCVEFANSALHPDDQRGWRASAQNLFWGDETSDGVAANVEAFRRFFIEECIQALPKQLVGILDPNWNSIADGASSVVETFKMYDINGTGKIERFELEQVMAALDPGWTPDTVKPIMDVVDANGDGSIDYAEFVNWIMAGVGVSTAGVRRAALAARLGTNTCEGLGFEEVRARYVSKFEVTLFIRETSGITLVSMQQDDGVWVAVEDAVEVSEEDAAQWPILFP